MLEEVRRVISLLPYADNHLPEIFSGVFSSALMPLFWRGSFSKCATWMLPALICAGIISIAGSLTSNYKLRRVGAITTLVFSSTLFISSSRYGIEADVAAAMLCFVAAWNYFKSGFEMSIRRMTK